MQNQETRGSLGAVGIPGALSNQPPGAGTTNPTDTQDNQNDPQNTNQSATRNFELDRTVSHVRNTPVTIRRLSVAVIADDRVTVNEQGETVRAPLSEDDIALITSVVRDAIGLDEARGDTVSVYNKSFLPPEPVEAIPDAPIWEQPWIWRLGKQLLAAMIVLLILFMVVRPAMRSLTAKQANATSHAQLSNANGELAEDQLALSSATGGTRLPAPEAYDQQLNMARALAAEDPKRVAKVVKNWVAEDE